MGKAQKRATKYQRGPIRSRKKEGKLTNFVGEEQTVKEGSKKERTRRADEQKPIDDLGKGGKLVCRKREKADCPNWVSPSIRKGGVILPRGEGGNWGTI